MKAQKKGSMKTVAIDAPIVNNKFIPSDFCSATTCPPPRLINEFPCQSTGFSMGYFHDPTDPNHTNMKNRQGRAEQQTAHTQMPAGLLDVTWLCFYCNNISRVSFSHIWKLRRKITGHVASRESEQQKSQEWHQASKMTRSSPWCNCRNADPFQFAVFLLSGHFFLFFLSLHSHTGLSVNFSAGSVISHFIMPRQIMVTSAGAQPRISEELQSGATTKDSCSFFRSLLLWSYRNCSMQKLDLTSASLHE